MKNYIRRALAPLGVALVLLFIGSVAALEDDGACDMKSVVKGQYCQSCEMILEKEDLGSDIEYFECPECETRSTKAGKCDDCEKDLVKKKSGKNVCKHCYEKPAEVDVCVKTCYECPECETRSAKAGKCSTCTDDEDAPVALKEVTVKALIEYYCEECGETSMKAGKCTDKECENFGKPLVKSCSMSGEFPHVKSK